MNKKIPMDQAGRVVLPKPLRRRLGLHAGDKLEVDAEGGVIRLRPVRQRASLCREKGIWVYRSGKKLGGTDLAELIDDARGERDRSFWK
jgi:AbrB family looped-hinge helix DNA binding protein